MSEQARSEQACPVCSQHTLALDQPPEIDAMGVQAFSDMVGMGDLHNEGAIGIVCLNCKTRWRDKACLRRAASRSPTWAPMRPARSTSVMTAGGDGGE